MKREKRHIPKFWSPFYITKSKPNSNDCRNKQSTPEYKSLTENIVACIKGVIVECFIKAIEYEKSEGSVFQ